MQSDPAWAQGLDLPRTDFADAKPTSPTQTDEASTRLRSRLTPEPSTGTRSTASVAALASNRRGDSDRRRITHHLATPQLTAHRA
jgi:hypothetical protein